MKSFIIHMNGDHNRQQNVQQLLSQLPDPTIIDAINGHDHMSGTNPALRAGDLHEPRYPFPLGPGEIGCFLSHRKCWARIVSENLEYALIAEDDLSLDPHLWPEALDLIQTHATADWFLRIPAKSREKPGVTVARRKNAVLFLPRSIGLQTVCQVVGQNAARRLLNASETLDRPVDTFLQMHWITGQPVHVIHPNGVGELTAELGGSTIQKKPRSGSVVKREAQRALYRARIARRPQSP